jgi:hypothetical protein
LQDVSKPGYKNFSELIFKSKLLNLVAPIVAKFVVKLIL